MTTTQPALCGCGCGRPKGPAHRGWAPACYFRWYRAGQPDDGPPPPRHGPEHTAALREEVTWLAEGGTSVAEAARRVGVTTETAERYLTPPTPPAPPAGCAHAGCTAAAVHHRWCGDHKDVRRLYHQARAEGLGRHAAAHLIGASWTSTYKWEPGQPGVGRPRKQAAA